jgi:hypothetical protein
MDFINRATQNQQQPGHVTSPHESVELGGRVRNDDRRGRGGDNDSLTRWSHLGSGILLFIVALLIATVAWLIFTTSTTSEYTYVDPSKLQAVFLNTGQVYFGDIQSMNHDYLVLTNIYYLQSNSTSTSTTAASTSAANQNVTLVKLGCELHMPYDRMIINNSEVTFWENLQPTGQVATAVATYQKSHPNGKQTCTAQSQTQSTSNPQNSTTTTK